MGYEVHVVSNDTGNGSHGQPACSYLLRSTIQWILEGSGIWRSHRCKAFTLPARQAEKNNQSRLQFEPRYHVTEMAEAAHPMHPEVESEPEYDGFSITQFIYDLLLVRLDPCLLYLLRVSFCTSDLWWPGCSLGYTRKDTSERDGIPQQFQQNLWQRQLNHYSHGLTRILVVLKVVQRIFQWYHGARTS
jgi:hypothetical protein